MFKPWLLKLIALFLIVVPEFGFAKAPATPPAEEHAQSLLSAFVSYTDLRMRSIQQSLEILASTTEARSARWKKMQPLLGGYQSMDGGLIVWFLRPDGTYYTVDKGLMDLKLSDRSYFPTLMSGRKVVGELVISKSTGRRSAVIAVPISDGGKVVGAIGASLFLDGLSDEVAAALALPADAAYFRSRTGWSDGSAQEDGASPCGPARDGKRIAHQGRERDAGETGRDHQLRVRWGKEEGGLPDVSADAMEVRHHVRVGVAGDDYLQKKTT